MYFELKSPIITFINSHLFSFILVLCCIFSFLTGCEKTEQQQSNPAKVVYSVVTKEKITLTNELPGRVSALIVSEVRPQVDGIILERLFVEGAYVEKGQVLYQIDPSIYRAAYNAAKATLAEAKANVTALALLEKRYRVLIQTKAIRQQELDDAISNHGQARARIDRAKAELDTASINLAYTQIKAPVSGQIGASSVTPGALVTAKQQEALAVIQQTGKVYIDINQSSTDTIRLRRAMAQGRMKANSSAAKVRLLLEDGTPYTPVDDKHEKGGPSWILGDLLFSEISVEQATGSIALRAVFDNPDGLLLPGMYVTAVIEEGSLDAVLIPQKSVLAGESGEHFVYVLRRQEAEPDSFQVERRSVELGRSWKNRWIVTSGLLPGDMLVVEGLQKATPGTTVRGTPAQNHAPYTPLEAR